DAAEYFDPNSTSSMKEALFRVISDPELRKNLIEKGAERIKRFTWEGCALQTLQILTDENANK
ncbi:glycosyltransferase family 1 protein, partial [Patescibacteria group bacterium]|nr:glycosyltransferase family 1 protein [Patescibacteria group bacterium]